MRDAEVYFMNSYMTKSMIDGNLEAVLKHTEKEKGIFDGNRCGVGPRTPRPPPPPPPPPPQPPPPPPPPPPSKLPDRSTKQLTEQCKQRAHHSPGIGRPALVDDAGDACAGTAPDDPWKVLGNGRGT